MKIGIIGSGEVALTLGRAFITEGNEVMLGSRDPSKEVLKKWKAENKTGKTGSFADAAAFGELLVLAVAGHGKQKIWDLLNPPAPSNRCAYSGVYPDS